MTDADDVRTPDAPLEERVLTLEPQEKEKGLREHMLRRRKFEQNHERKRGLRERMLRWREYEPRLARKPVDKL